MPTFGERLRMLRMEKNLTQEQLGSFFNMRKSRISQYELDKRQADDEAKKQFANFFNVSVDYLIGRSDIRDARISFFKENEDAVLDNIYKIYHQLPAEKQKDLEQYARFLKNKDKLNEDL